MAENRETLDIEGLLRFYAEAGVDMPLSETPIDRFAEPQRPAPTQPAMQTPSAPERPGSSPAPHQRLLPPADLFKLRPIFPIRRRLRLRAKRRRRLQRWTNCGKSLPHSMAAI